MLYASFLITNAHAYSKNETQFVKVDESTQVLENINNNSNIVYPSKQEVEAKKLAHKILKLEQLKDSKGRPLYELKYKNMNDLFETCLLICANEDRIFTRYHIAAVLIKESRLDSHAYNSRDGGKGIAQVMRKYWKKELPWYTNEYDKAQSIKACAAVLNKLHKKRKRVWLTVKCYNSANKSFSAYGAPVQRIHDLLLAV